MNLIYDRTRSDADRAIYLRNIPWEEMTPAEQLEWLTNLKGAYNYSDLNRVGEAVA